MPLSEQDQRLLWIFADHARAFAAGIAPPQMYRADERRRRRTLAEDLAAWSPGATPESAFASFVRVGALSKGLWGDSFELSPQGRALIRAALGDERALSQLIANWAA